jgi:hypothetical protein
MTLAVITVRVPERLRKQMRSLTDVDWSSVVRDAIEARVRLESVEPERDWDRVREADKITEAIFAEMYRKYGHVRYDSTETIREWRAGKWNALSFN